MKGTAGVHGLQLQGHLEPGRGSMCWEESSEAAWQEMTSRRKPPAGDELCGLRSFCSWVDLRSKDRREFDAYTLWKWNPFKCFVHLHSCYLSSTLEMKPEKMHLGLDLLVPHQGTGTGRMAYGRAVCRVGDGEEKQGNSFFLKFVISGQFSPHIYFIIILIWKLTVCSSLYTHYLL